MWNSLPVGVGHPRRRQARLGVVGVDVDDRDLEPLGEVARVGRRARVLPLGRETELVVGDDVDGPAGLVAGQAAEVERLGRDALAGERRVPVQQHRQRALLVLTGGPATSRFSCAARAMPSTTGLTCSRWLGFGARLISTCSSASASLRW